MRSDLFWSKVEKTDGCWEWHGATVNGYGLVPVVRDGRWTTARAHRIAYELLVGPIPHGLVLDHLCHDITCAGGVTCPHRRCVNPSHLTPTTRAENARRGLLGRRSTHCKWGHPLVYESGRSRCPVCQRAAYRRWKGRTEASHTRRIPHGRNGAIRYLMSTLVLALLLAAADSQATRTPAHYGHPSTWFKKHAPADRKVAILQGRVKHSRDVARFFENHPRLARTKQGRIQAWQHRRMGRWAARRLRQERRITWLTLPDTGDWRTAARLVQRAYPDTYQWLMSCSASEGSWGEWVWNNEGSGVGGWLQFQPSTFDRMFSAAQADVRKRGFRLPGTATHWRHPLAQALAGAWGLTHGRRHEWHGAGC